MSPLSIQPNNVRLEQINRQLTLFIPTEDSKGLLRDVEPNFVTVSDHLLTEIIIFVCLEVIICWNI